MSSHTTISYVSISEDNERAIRCTEVLFNLEYFDNDAKKFLEYLNSERRSTQTTALHMAAITGNSGLIELLIGKGADAMKSDDDGFTVLHHAVDNGKGHIYTVRA